MVKAKARTTAPGEIKLLGAIKIDDEIFCEGDIVVVKHTNDTYYGETAVGKIRKIDLYDNFIIVDCSARFETNTIRLPYDKIKEVRAYVDGEEDKDKYEVEDLF